MKISDNEFESFILTLFGDGATNGDIVFINDKDEELVTRDLDEAIEFDPAYVGLETALGETIGFALERGSHGVKQNPSATYDNLDVYFLEKAVKITDVQQIFDAYGEDVAFEIPLAKYKLADQDFYGLNDFISAKQDEILPLEEVVDKGVKVTFAMASSAKRGEGAWKNIEGTVGQFIEMLTLHQEGKKDGQCFLQGELAGSGRSAKSLIKNYFIGLDLDTGETSEEIDERLAETGLAYVRYTTHSHMKDLSEVKRDSFFKWSGMNATKNVDVKQLKIYLAEVRGFIPRVVEHLEVLEDAKVSEEGTLTIIRHAKMPKHRIIFFLSEPFVFQGKANQTDEIKAWKEHYHGFGTDLGFVYDNSCLDPARLFYLPRHDKDQPYETRFVDGDYVDLRSYERIAMKRDTHSQSINAFSDAAKSLGVVSDGMFVEGYNLKRWIMTHDCDIVSLLEEHYPDGVKSPRTNGPGYHIECPFEDEHSKAGGLGTFAINGSENDKGFHIHCTHDSCHGRNKLDYIKKMVELEWITVGDLQDETYCPSIERLDEIKEEEDQPADEVDVEEILQKIGKKETTKDQAVDLLRQIGKTDIDQEEFEELAEEVRKKKRMTKREIKKSFPNKFEKSKKEVQAFLDEAEKKIAEYNDRYALVNVGNASILDSEMDWDDSPFTKLETWKIMNSNQKVLVSNGKGDSKLEFLTKMWMESAQRKTYTGVMFDPGPHPNNKKYNLFKGFNTIARKGSWNLLKNHIYEVLCHSDEKIFMWLMTWMSNIIQRPWEKKGSALVVRGAKGAGKTTVFDYFSRLLTPYAMTSSQPEHITGKFNWHFRDKLLVIAEEGLFAGSSRDDSIIKDLITGKKMLMEPKGIDPFNMDQYIRLVIISNEDWVINATADERRYLVLDVSNEYVGDGDYFEAISNQMENGGLEAMMYELTNFEPPFVESWNILRKPPKTAALAKQVSRSIPVWEKFFIGLVENGGVSDLGIEAGNIELNYDQPTEVNRDELRMHFYNSLRTTSSKYHQTPEAFKELAEKYLPGSKYLKRKNGDIYMRIPSLNEMIDHIQSTHKINLDIIEFEKE